MALSPNYNWSEPDNSSLVKNGAADIRTLGDAIDTSVWNVGFGQAGKNKIINGDFSVWQRNTSITLGSGALATYGADRFIFEAYGSSTAATVTRQTFTPGAAPVAGYEGRFFARLTNFATATAWQIRQRVENVQTFAGQTVTFSFWAKASTSIALDQIQVIQNFGSGGSTAVTTVATAPTLTTSWVRYKATVSVPSISGKTIGTNSYLEFTFYQGSNTPNSSTVDVWGWQAEQGSVATPFQTASGGSIQGELAMCQRYYVRTTANGNLSRFAIGMADSTTTTALIYNSPVSMRIVPIIDFGSLQIHEPGNNVFNLSALTISSISNTTQFTLATSGSTGLTLYRPDFLIGTSSSAYLAFSAEL